MPFIGLELGLSATAAIFTVNSTGDASDPVPGDGVCGTVAIDPTHSGGPCTLRAAIQTADSHSGTDGIEIVLRAGSVINLTGALPNLSDSVGIIGPGASLVTVRRGTGGSYRIFLVTTTGFASFSGLTISNGLGGISNVNAGTVTVKDCILSGNTTSNGLGGGIFNNSTGRVNVTNSTFSNNSADKGGAIYNNTRGQVDVTNCTFLSNGASKGGAIGNAGGTFNVTNCTFTDNAANLIGGAIYNIFGTANVLSSTFNANIANDSVVDGGGAICNGDSNGFFSGFLNVTNSTFVANFAFEGAAIDSIAGSTTTVTNSTFSGNRVGFGDSGGGIANDSTGPVNVKSCIIAGSSAQPNSTAPRSDVSGAFSSAGFNLIGRTDGSTGFTAATDQTGTIVSPLDPKLDPAGLRDNGGPTDTIALLTGSPAIDKGASAGLTGTLITDQRGVGYSRIINKSVPNATDGDGTDTGAFEVGSQIKAVSRKTHGTTGNFDIKLPLAGPKIGVECREAGSSGAFQLILTFPKTITVASANAVPDPATAGATGSISSFSVSGSTVTVNLTGVSNAQTILVTLFRVSDGTNTNDVSVSMGVLLGDANDDGSVKDADVTLTQSKIGLAVSKANFREDVDINGSIDSTDVNLVTSKKGTTLP